MPRPISINFQECAFTIPWSDNRQELHDGAYNVILEGKHVPDSQTTRAFVYDITRMGESALITARAPEFGGNLPAESETVVVREGDRLTIRARVSAVRRQSVEGTQGKRQVVHKAISQEELPEWAAALLERHGMVPERVVCTNYQSVHVGRKNQRFAINEVSIEAVVTIGAADQFVSAFLGGLGRHKGYGLGKMEVMS